MPAESAYYAALSGMLLLYLECLRPGMILPGIAGAGLTVCGVYFLVQASLSPMGGVLLGLSGILFALELVRDSRFLFLCAAIVLFAAGTWRLFPSNSSVPSHSFVRLLAALLFAGCTAFLAWSARTARENKEVDLK